MIKRESSCVKFSSRSKMSYQKVLQANGFCTLALDTPNCELQTGKKHLTLRSNYRYARGCKHIGGLTATTTATAAIFAYQGKAELHHEN